MGEGFAGMTRRSPIPEAALGMHLAILATSGAGKTVTSKGAVEDLLDAGERTAIIDPTGVWHGLRTLANGKPGFPVVIFGGKHADVPLDHTAGEALAKLIAKQNLPAIVDVQLMTVKQRSLFFADFAEALMRENDEPLHLVIDEAHLFMPQQPPRDPQGLSVRMLHAGNNLVSGGRARGIAVNLISQRASKLHKDSLTQVQTLVAMQNVHALDRATVVDFVKGFAGKETADKIEASLASLQTGEGWIYSPKLGVLERTRFPMIRTLDTSDRPKPGEKRPPPSSLAKVDLKAIVAALAPPAADATPDGMPSGSRSGGKDAKRPGAKAAPVAKTFTEAEFEQAKREAFDDGMIAGRRAERNQIRQAFSGAFAALPALLDRMPQQRLSSDARAELVRALEPFAVRMLEALERTPSGLSSKQLAGALKVKGGDGRWYRNLDALISAGLVKRRGDVLTAPHISEKSK